MKNFLKLTFIAAVAVSAGYTAYTQSQKAEMLSDLTLQNIEALANGENDDDGYAIVQIDAFTHTKHCTGNGDLDC